jgi:hypothetical protein
LNAVVCAEKPKGKAALPLQNFLREVDPEVQCERRFEWLFLPKQAELFPAEGDVRDALIAHCRENREKHRFKTACDPDTLLVDQTVRGRSRILEIDFYLPKHGLAIEFDERQHFTLERRASLAAYPGKDFPFDISKWSDLCSKSVIDYTPPCRDWQRAFRDSVRDIRCRAHGVPLIRIYYRDLPALFSSGIAQFIQGLPTTKTAQVN